MRWKMKKKTKWGLFKLPVKIKQINDFVQKQKVAVNDVMITDCENDY